MRSVLKLLWSPMVRGLIFLSQKYSAGLVLLSFNASEELHSLQETMNAWSEARRQLGSSASCSIRVRRVGWQLLGEDYVKPGELF